MSWESKVRGTRARFGAQAEPFAEHFPRSRAPWKGRRETRCPYLSRSGHVVLAELLPSPQQAAGKLPPVWLRTRVTKCPGRGAGALLGACWPQLKGEAGSVGGVSPGVGPSPESRGLSVVNLHLMPGAARLVSASVERRSWLAAGRCQWVLVRLHGEWADILWGGFYRWLCCRAMPCPHCLKGTESSDRFFSSGFFWQVRGEEIGGTAGASSGSPCCQGVAFDLAAVHAKVFAKGLEIKKRKRRQ